MKENPAQRASKRNLRRGLSHILVLCLALVWMYPAPFWAFESGPRALAVTSLYSVTVVRALDSSVTYGGASTLVTSFNITAHAAGLRLRKTQGFRIMYDNTVLQLATWSGSAVTPPTVSGELGAYVPGAGYSDNANLRDIVYVYPGISADASMGALSVETSSYTTSYALPVNTAYNLSKIRFVFRPGKGVSNLTDSSIRLMTEAELRTHQQRSAVYINDSTDTEYYYRELDANGLPIPDDNFTLPTPVFTPMDIPSTGVRVIGSVQSYVPQRVTTLKLLLGSSVAYETTIEPGTPSTARTTQAFAFPSVAPGTYTLEVTKMSHLKYTVRNIVVGTTELNLQNDPRSGARLISMICGDADGDGIQVGDSDLNTLLHPANYLRTIARGANPAADLDGDNYVGDSDLNIILSPTSYLKRPVVIN